MGDYSDLSSIQHILSGKAAWRNRVAERYPEDPRNALAADALTALATSNDGLSPHIEARLSPYWDDPKLPKTVDDIATNVGFSKNSAVNLTDFLLSVANCLDGGSRKNPLRSTQMSQAEICDAFEDAASAYLAWNDGDLEPAILVGGSHALISDVFARMWNCSDLMPASLCRYIACEVLVNEEKPFPRQGATFAQAARRLLPLVKEARNAARQ